MRIIAHGQDPHDKKAICNNCNTTVSYEPSDVQLEKGQVRHALQGNFTTTNLYSGGYKYLECPCCGERIPIKAGIRHEDTW